MASPEEDLERRVSALEENVGRLRGELERARGDAAAARILAGGADRDVGEMRQELRAHTRALNALRETQLEQGDRLTGITGRIDSLEAEMRRGFALVNAGMTQIVGAP